MPGVVILGEVMSCIRLHMHGIEVIAVPAVKFLTPLLPGIRVRLSVDKKQESLLGFSCHAENKLICNGQIRFKV